MDARLWVVEKECSDGAEAEYDGIDVERPSPTPNCGFDKSACVDGTNDLANGTEKMLGSSPEGSCESRDDFSKCSG